MEGPCVGHMQGGLGMQVTLPEFHQKQLPILEHVILQLHLHVYDIVIFALPICSQHSLISYVPAILHHRHRISFLFKYVFPS